jgi:hypothetical protein
MFVQVVELFALRHSLGAKRFNARVGDKMVLRTHGSSGVQQRVLFSRTSPTSGFTASGPGAPKQVGKPDDVLAQAPVGSRVRWTSTLLVAKASDVPFGKQFETQDARWFAWQNENAVKVGPDRYAAHGVGGGRVSGKEIEDALVEITAGQFPDKSKSEIRAGIYISEIEVYDQPASSGQIEPNADNPRQGARP